MRFTQITGMFISLAITAAPVSALPKQDTVYSGCSVMAQPSTLKACFCSTEWGVMPERMAKCCPHGHINASGDSCINLTSQQGSDFVACCFRG